MKDQTQAALIDSLVYGAGAVHIDRHLNVKHVPYRKLVKMAIEKLNGKPKTRRQRKKAAQLAFKRLNRSIWDLLDTLE